MACALRVAKKHLRRVPTLRASRTCSDVAPGADSLSKGTRLTLPRTPTHSAPSNVTTSHHCGRRARLAVSLLRRLALAVLAAVIMSSSNAWIEGYIDALVRQHECRFVLRLADDVSQMRAGEPVGEPIQGAPAVDADQRLYVRPCIRAVCCCKLKLLFMRYPFCCRRRHTTYGS